MGVGAGKYRHFVTIQRFTTSKGTYGTDQKDWYDDVDDIPCEIRPLRGEEYFRSRQTQAFVSHKITIRYTLLSDGTKIKPSNARLTTDNGDRVFNIESIIDPFERHKELELMVVEEI
jgi:head-tail adaptor